MKAAPNHLSVTAILLCWYNMFSIISFTSFSDDSGVTIVTGNGEPKLMPPNNARSLFIGPMDMFMGPERLFLHVLVCQYWFMSSKVRAMLHPLQTADSSLSTDLYIYFMQF
ncbi:hypothetical protein G6F70_006314 [Rhizopus microsporus]|nr:hypothetical protein G6F71_006212 [Rhizopus microsporus]KAG1197846.1 hypothetical protein G6F70_006314 [Rhizopus microsporus]KAG1206742.1 hypothetical protein G6F69_008603 [Rhizopus microsporus]KAG1227799.1 hypothetical protein G6F67_008222 [Rhizopus microsporus]KAG1263436.1 hypothetical protein G6F68_005150 [Rhizopus microsporus]